MKAKKVMLAVLILSSFLLFSCTYQQQGNRALEEQTTEDIIPVQEKELLPTNEEKVSEPEKNIQETMQSCQFSGECPAGKECINGFCNTLEETFTRLQALASSPCEKECTLQKVYLKTSDGEEYALSPGQGSYSYVGALEWKILLSPSQCQQLNAFVPFKFISKKTGEIIGEEIVTVPAGFKSKVITHPTIPRVAFTVEVIKVDEKCG